MFTNYRFNLVYDYILLSMKYCNLSQDRTTGPPDYVISDSKKFISTEGTNSFFSDHLTIYELIWSVIMYSDPVCCFCTHSHVVYPLNHSVCSTKHFLAYYKSIKQNYKITTNYKPKKTVCFSYNSFRISSKVYSWEKGE